MTTLKEFLFSTDKDNPKSKKFGEIKGQKFIIPFLQRTYKWKPAQAIQLLEDLQEFTLPTNSKEKYCLQPLAVCRNGESWEVLDGQQRLTTLLILHRALFQWTGVESTPYKQNYAKEDGREDSILTNFLTESDLQDDIILTTNQDIYNMSRVRKEIKKWLASHPECIEYLKELFTPGGKDLLFLWYEVDYEARHKTFKNLNTGKIALTNADLVKALLLSENSTKIKDKALVAAQFREMEITLENDKFWYSICPYDSDSTHPRIDFLFNIVAQVSPSVYWANEDSARTSFDYFYNKKDNLQTEWEKVRDTFLRLTDLANSPESYHYMGYLVYISCNHARKQQRQQQRFKDTTWTVFKALELYREHGFDKAIEKMRQLIKKQLSLKELPDYLDKAQCRRVFVLHNIETILSRLEALKSIYPSKNDTDIAFPFELLYAHNWDIEHIASQTDNDLTSEKDRQDWLEGFKSDYADIATSCAEKIMAYSAATTKRDKDSTFNDLYKNTIAAIENQMKEKGLSPIGENDKDDISNLVLLDDHTNRSYHNSLMPRKRRVVLFAADEGLYEEKISVAYIPPCTLKVFQKSYNRATTNLTSLEWIKPDAEAYRKDIENKLEYYLS